MDARARRRSKRRKFLREIGSIVLGVLIALGLGTVATEIGWLIDVRNAKKAIGEELGEILGQGQERVHLYPCVERKLTSIGGILDEADKSGRLPPVGDIGDPPWRTWPHNVWDSTLGSDTASHFDRGTLDNISGVYELVTFIDRYTGDEVEAWRKLYAIVGPGRMISHDEVVSLRDALSSARLSNRMITSSSIRASQIARAYGLPVDQYVVSQWANAPIDRYCAPIARPNAETYGESSMRDAFERVQKHPITRESLGTSK